jgi:hypothetical protein
MKNRNEIIDMNYDKLDPFLISEMGNIIDTKRRLFEVFIRATKPPVGAEIGYLNNLGVRNIPKNRKIFTGTLSIDGISSLSDVSWITSIKLSRKLRPNIYPTIHPKNQVA